MRILVVEDEPTLRAQLVQAIAAAVHTVESASDGATAHYLGDVEAFDAVVLDLGLPDGDGVDLIRDLRGWSAMPVIVLSARGTVGDRIEGLESGADDYVPKPFSPAELILRVKRVLERTTDDAGGASAATAATTGPRILQHNDLTMDLDRHEVTIGGEQVMLTTAEFRLLAALIGANGRVLTRDQLLDALHGLGEADVLDRAIDAHVRRLRDKLNDEPDNPRFVATVRGVGYRAAPSTS